MSVRLGAVTGVIHHARGVLNALKVGRTVTITPEVLAIIARDKHRLADLHHHAQALEDYVKELADSQLDEKENE